MRRPVLLALLLLILTWAPAPAHASGPSCDNPQAAARSLLDWLQREQWDPARAATCLGLPDDLRGEGPDRAVRLKMVLDARGLYVPVGSMSLDPDYTNADGLHRAEPIPTFPLLALEKRQDQWVWSPDLVQATDQLYAETFSDLSGRVKSALGPQYDFRLLGIQSWQWVTLGLLFSLAAILGFLAQLLLADQVLRFADRAKIKLDRDVVAGTRWPLTSFVIGSVLVWGVPDVQLGVHGTRALLFVANTLTSLAAVLILARVVDLGAHYFARRAASTESRMDDQVIPLVQRAAKITIWVLGIVFVVQNMGVDVASLLAGLGIGGLAFALAAKDTVENLFGSLTIFTDRPFQVGDWVVVGDGVEGVVEEVGFRSTRVRTFYQSVVSVPNALVANSRIDNMGHRHYRRVKTTLGLNYNATPEQVDAFVGRVRAHLESNPAVWDGTREVHLAAFGESSLDVMVYFFLDVPDWSAELRERAQIFYTFMRIAKEEGVEFAFPSTSVYVEKLPSPAGPAAR